VHCTLQLPIPQYVFDNWFLIWFSKTSNHQVLDLDETLLHTYRDVNAGHSEPDYIIYASENTNQIITAGTLRPGVKKFLKWASEIFEVVVWTAGDDDYAATVMDILDADRQYIS
jgi:TFIIF-interacting CTD phosphatase-like protein